MSPKTNKCWLSFLQIIRSKFLGQEVLDYSYNNQSHTQESYKCLESYSQSNLSQFLNWLCLLKLFTSIVWGQMCAKMSSLHTTKMVSTTPGSAGGPLHKALLCWCRLVEEKDDGSAPRKALPYRAPQYESNISLIKTFLIF